MLFIFGFYYVIHILICRWILKKNLASQLPSLVLWRKKDNPNYMYTESQRLGMWDNKVMDECPLFLDFREGKYPTKDKAQYSVCSGGEE